MNKQELIKKIADEGWAHRMADGIVNAIDAEGWLRNPGEPIDPADIRKGDRVRFASPSGRIAEYTAEATPARPEDDPCDWFLLDRPDPEPTNAEKLKAVLDAIGDSTGGYREHLASKLDEAGVKAPGGDDD
ncbi:hypothetical protein [Brevibacterium oceani]|uniref:hypothetical protein n=1 Tax=Brevibacterium oceani TaxID=358099 RepID=UPI0015E75CB2|nr:hypothetical protein [Brevibacterium oceani]